MQNFKLRFVLVALLALLGVACENTVTPTEVLVGIDSDLRVGEQLQRIDVEVYAGNGMGLMLHSASFPLAAPGGKGLALPLSFSVVPSTQRDTRSFRVVVTGIGTLAAGAALGPIVEKQMVAAFRPNTQIRLDVFLSQICLGKLCRDAAGRRGDLTCNAAGECDVVPTKSEPEPSNDASTPDAADLDAARPDAAISPDAAPATDARTEAGPGPLDAGSDAPTPPEDASGADADAGPPLPTTECDATRSCNPGYACVQEKCVSKCMQTQCDPNATCSLMAGAPVCTCGNGFIQMINSGVVTCTADVSCTQLACDTNAGCVLNTDQTRSCVCKPGYSGSGKTCAPVDCGAASLSNGTATAVNGITTYGGTVNYACNTGYTRSGAASAMCGTDAHWSATATCTPVDCGTPTLLNGTATLTGTTTTFGSGATYTCNPGYTRSSATPATCGANKSWSPVPTCTPVSCSAPPANAAKLTVTTNNGNQLNSVATYGCTEGTLQGNLTRTCQVNGFWSGSTPSCLYCGDGMIISEQCDPNHSNYTYWSCSPSCTRISGYISCFDSNDCLNGQVCYPGLGFCTQSCSLSSQCPIINGGVTSRRCPIEFDASGTGVCIAAGCNTAADCAPGLRCYVGGSTHYCAGCAASDTCI